MCFNRLFRRRSCNCCHTRCYPAAGNAAQVYTMYSLHRFVDVPMHIYYGPGYSQQQVLESIDQSLITMSDCAQTLQAGMQYPCGCNRCC